MDIDHILAVFNRQEVRYLLIGGVNFLLRHKPVLTFDVDFWIEDSDGNRRCCELALAELDCEWGRTDEAWGPVARMPAGWMSQQAIYCLSSPHGAIDVFRHVHGLSDWQGCLAKSVAGRTAAGTAYRGLSDEDMLRCQLSLDPTSQKVDRIRDLREALSSDGHTETT